MKADDIRSLSDADLKTRVTELQEEQFRLRFRSATETLEQPLRLRSIRRDIARLLTVLRERELSAQPARGTSKARRAAAPAAKQQAAKQGARKASPRKATTRTATSRRAAK